MKQNNKQQNERKSMNNRFDELAKQLAQSTTRRQALKKFGVAAAGALLASFGLASKGEARACLPSRSGCMYNHQCCSHRCVQPPPGGLGPLCG
jgi:hypothetical protein